MRALHAWLSRDEMQQLYPQFLQKGGYYPTPSYLLDVLHAFLTHQPLPSLDNYNTQTNASETKTKGIRLFRTVSSKSLQREQEKHTESENGEKIYRCSCGGVYDENEDGAFWIGCGDGTLGDGCGRWFHGECVGVTPELAELIPTFYCSECRAKRRVQQTNTQFVSIPLEEKYFHPQQQHQQPHTQSQTQQRETSLKYNNDNTNTHHYTCSSNVLPTSQIVQNANGRFHVSSSHELTHYSSPTMSHTSVILNAPFVSQTQLVPSDPLANLYAVANTSNIETLTPASSTQTSSFPFSIQPYSRHVYRSPTVLMTPQQTAISSSSLSHTATVTGPTSSTTSTLPSLDAGPSQKRKPNDQQTPNDSQYIGSISFNSVDPSLQLFSSHYNDFYS